MPDKDILNSITKLLKDNNLPYEDLISSQVEFITVYKDETLVGCIGVEKYGKNGLLRSLAVDDAYKGCGIGKKLIDDMLSKSKLDGIKQLHLLTTTADKYFKKYGFKNAERSDAPQSILQSKEFSDICPASSVYMTIDTL